MTKEQGPNQQKADFGEKLEKDKRNLRRVNALLKEPGGKSWPDRFKLGELPTESTEEKLIFLDRGARVGNITAYLNERIRPHLEEKIKKNRVEKNITSLRGSYEKTKQGLPGISKDIITKAERVVKDLEKEQRKKAAKEGVKERKVPKRTKKRSEKGTGREKGLFTTHDLWNELQDIYGGHKRSLQTTVSSILKRNPDIKIAKTKRKERFFERKDFEALTEEVKKITRHKKQQEMSPALSQEISPAPPQEEHEKLTSLPEEITRQEGKKT